MSGITYPIDWVHEDKGWGRLHQGHSLDHDALLADLVRNGGDARRPEDGYILAVTERHFRILAHVKWCERHDDPCERNGEWHTHWAAIKPTADPAHWFTEVFWTPALSATNDSR